MSFAAKRRGENAETNRDDTSVELATSESGLGRRKEGFRGKK